MLTKQSLDFLKDLSQNNNRDWYHANKERYNSDLKLPFEAFIGELIEAYKSIDPEIAIDAKAAVFRIYRDTRFSKDKTPYKTHVGAVISRYGRKGHEYPGNYVHVEQGRLMLGGGAYFMDKNNLQKVREHIMKYPKTFSKLIENTDFVKKYGEIKGEKNKRIPKEFREFAEEQALIFNKQFYFMAELDPKHILGEKGVDFAMDYFRAGQTLTSFLKEGMGLE